MKSRIIKRIKKFVSSFFYNNFTLVELLIVVSIIAILMSILLPALYRSKKAANKLSCINNQKQMMIGTLHWANDHDFWMIPAWWPAQLPAYNINKDKIKCPEQQSGYSYGLNINFFSKRWLFDWQPPGHNFYSHHSRFKLNQVSKPSQLTCFLENTTYYALWQDNPFIYSQYSHKTRERHRGGATIGFVDGHAAFKHHSWIQTSASTPPFKANGDIDFGGEYFRIW